MLAANVINSIKKDAIIGSVFHLFYPDTNTSILFDGDFVTPIIWGSKSVVMSWVKRLDDLLEQEPTYKVRIYSYINTPEGYRRVDTYNGPIETIGKYIRRC